MDKYEELRKREIRAWERELDFAKQRGDDAARKRIRNHLRKSLNHWRVGRRTTREDTNQIAHRVTQEVIKRTESW
jgi:hypothetical protein